jgi:DNA (cytosine-5)-methyltransferase 1
VILDLFAGPGGWSEGLRLLGLADIGFELDPWACATRAAAGHATVRADVAAMPVTQFTGKLAGLIASPPCQGLSAAGLREGVADLDLVIELLGLLWGGHDRRAAYAEKMADPRSLLLAEPLRYALAARPEWVALEQVPAALPVWEATAGYLRAEGYSAWTGTLNAADYGVPQTRTRAILIASRVRRVTRPEPTHYDPRKGQQLWGEPWVSMAEALGWGATERPSPSVTGGVTASGGAEPFASHSRARLEADRDRGAWVLHTNRGQEADGSRQTLDPLSAPAPALTAKSGGQWVLRNNTQANAATRSVAAPAGTLFFSARGNDVSWVNGSGESVRITVEEAAVLQSFRRNYPWQGAKTRAFQQVGNAVPPLLAAHVIAEAAGIPLAAAGSERAA